MSQERAPDSILIAAPIGADARNLAHAVGRQAGRVPVICPDALDLGSALYRGCGAVIVTEEALTSEVMAMLHRVFASQPPWSDIPVILLANSGPRNFGQLLATRLRGPRRSITLLERPLSSVALLATLDTLLAARHRQYEIRDLLDERDALLSSLESRVAERTAELRRVIEDMESFSYSVSHDLRAPLRSLAGYAEALQEDHGGELSPGARAYCGKIVRAARRMDSLTQDILAYTRVARREMEIVPVDLDGLVSEVIEQYPALVNSAARIHVERPLGGVRGHAPSLIQCLSNLLGNALKFGLEGRIPRIDVRSCLCGERRRILVRDNGRGIDPADHDRIFRMFERAAGSSIAGTGIGLAIVKKAVERMNGGVGVNSSPGRGAEFWIELADAPPPAATAAAPKDLASFWTPAGIPAAPVTAAP